MSDSYELEHTAERPDASISIGHLVRILREYSAIIRLSMIAVAAGCVILTVALYLLTPAERVSTLSFRLVFEGADRGQYPNQAKFSSAEIISTPVLLRVFNQNNLGRFTSFADFSNSVVVLEASAAQDALRLEYQPRLSDPRLTPIDRERIQREYESKLASLNKSEHAIHYLQTSKRGTIPAVVIRKVLHDILKEWANFASREQHVLEYRVSVISPDVVSPTPIEENNPLVATEVLRSGIQRIVANVDELHALPSAKLIRSTRDNLSLVDIRIRLDNLVRFRLEPLTHHIGTARLDDRVETIQFLEAQLAYDQRQLDAQQRVAEAARHAMAMYMNGQTGEEPLESSSPVDPIPPGRSVVGSDTVTPQISDSFIERLIQLASNASDQEYRQTLAERYRESAIGVVPLQKAVEYDRSILDLLKKSGGGSNITRQAVDEQIRATRAEADELVGKIHEIYQKTSANLNPSTELMTITGAPTTRVERTLSAKKLVLFGILFWLLALPIVIFICILHHRIREEERTEDLGTSSQAIESAV